MKTNLLEPIALCLLLISTLTVMSNVTIAPALPGLANEFSGTPSADFSSKDAVTDPSFICGDFRANIRLGQLG